MAINGRSERWLSSFAPPVAKKYPAKRTSGARYDPRDRCWYRLGSRCVPPQHQSRNRTKTKAAEIEHAIRHHLAVDLSDDPDLQGSFSEALKKIFEEFQNNWAKIFEELEKLRQRIIDAGKEPTYGLHRKKHMPFFRMLKKELFGDAELDEDGISSLVSLTQQVFGEVERELKLAGFWESIPARKAPCPVIQ